MVKCKTSTVISVSYFETRFLMIVRPLQFRSKRTFAKYTNHSVIAAVNKSHFQTWDVMKSLSSVRILVLLYLRLGIDCDRMHPVTPNDEPNVFH